MMPRHALAALGAVWMALSSCTTTEKTTSSLEQGNHFAQDGLWREAAESYQAFLSKKDPKSPIAHRNLGMVLVRLGDYKRAIHHLEASMPTFAEDFDANFYLGEAHRAREQFAEAIFRYQKCTKINPNEPRALKALAWAYFKIRYYKEALATVRSLRRADKSDLQAYLIYARTLIELKRPEDALKVLRKGRAKAGNKLHAFFYSVEGDAHLQRNDLNQAFEAYRLALKDDPMLAGALLGMGKLAIKKGDTKKAIEFLERSVRIRPRLPEAHFLLGQAYETTDPMKSVRYYKYFHKQAAEDPYFLDELLQARQRMTRLSQTTKAAKATK